MAGIIGTAADESLAGTASDDTIDGAAGIDTLEGGFGNDLYIVDQTRRTVSGVDGHYPDVVVEAADGGVDTVLWTGIGGFQLADNVENLIAEDRFAGPAHGNSLANVMTAAAAYDAGFGRYGSDAMFHGGDGGDTLNGGSGDDELHGDAGADLLVGNHDPADLPGAFDEDVLDGGAGVDTLIGGRGPDTYWLSDVEDVIVEAAAPASLSELDAYYSYHWDVAYWQGEGRYVLADNVEQLHLRGAASEATGSAAGDVVFIDYGSYDTFGELIGEPGQAADVDGAGGDDTVLGGSGGDTLRGGEDDDQLRGGYGTDTLHGGAGDDDLLGDPDGVQPQNEGDVLFGDEGADVLDGQFGDDSLDGGADDDVLLGNYGDDTLTGGAGSDRFAGGPGVNVVTDFTDGEDFILAGRNLNGVFIEQDGTDTLIRFGTGDDFVTRLLGVDAATVTAEDFVFLLAGDDSDNELDGGAQDDVVLGGEGDDTANGAGGADDVDGGVGADALSGGAGDDTVSGGSGEDTLDGGAGVDSLSGGSGDDWYVVEEGDFVWEEDDEGVDWVETDGDYALGDNLENLDLVDPEASAKLATARVAPGATAGRSEGAGNDLDNRIDGNSVGNRLLGRQGEDVLLGQDGSDRLHGGAGDDRLIGGAGRDVLSGGDGADRFRYLDLTDKGDLIRDFDAAEGDRIDLSRLDADTGLAGDQAFRFVDAFSGAAGEATLIFDGARTRLRLDVDGDGSSDFALTFLGEVTSADGWVL